jgi:hypothetical protein
MSSSRSPCIRKLSVMSSTLSQDKKTGQRLEPGILILLCSKKSLVESRLKEGNLHLRFLSLERVQGWEPLHVATAVKLAIGTLLALLP